MAYCDIDDVRKALPHRLINENTEPTLAEVTEHITEAASIMDGLLTTFGFAVPVAGGTNGLNILKRLNAIRAATFVLEGAQGEEGLEPSRIKDYRREYDSWMAAGDNKGKGAGIIKLNPGVLEGITSDTTSKKRQGTGGRIRSYATDNGDGLTIAGGDFDAEFTRDEKY